jgi:hypothetical protein
LKLGDHKTLKLVKLDKKEIIMDMINVDSSNLAAVGYDEESSILQVEFKNGGTYQYFDVPENLFEGLRDADSVGGFLAKNIKGGFRFSKV